MFTEILGVIIIIGIILVLLIRHNSMNSVSDDDVQTGTAANHFKRELEVTGNEILHEIDQKIDELETVIALADKKLENLKIYSALLAEYENKKTLSIDQKSLKSDPEKFNKVLENVEKNEYGGSLDIVAPDDEKLLYSELLSDTKKEAVNQDKRPAGKNRAIDDKRAGHDLSIMSQKVYDLLDKKMSIEEISRQLSVGRGAIDMIAKMYIKDKQNK